MSPEGHDDALAEHLRRIERYMQGCTLLRFPRARSALRAELARVLDEAMPDVVATWVGQIGPAFGDHCAGCPLRERCTTSKAGRQINVHPKRDTLQRVLSAGASMTGDLHDIPGGVVFTFADPDGNELTVQQNGITCAELGVASA